MLPISCNLCVLLLFQRGSGACVSEISTRHLFKTKLFVLLDRASHGVYDTGQYVWQDGYVRYLNESKWQPSCLEAVSGVAEGGCVEADEVAVTAPHRPHQARVHE